MKTLYMVVWEDEDSMDHGIHGGYFCPILANHTVKTMSEANDGRSYELKITALTEEVVS